MSERDENLNQEPDLVELVDDAGKTITMMVVDYFFYNGEEYVILTDHLPDADAAQEPDSMDCYVMKVNSFTDENGEEMEEFEPVEDEALEEKLIQVASTMLNEDEDEEEV